MTTETRVLGLPNLMQNLRTLEEKLALSILRQSSRKAANVYLAATRATTYGTGRQKITGLLQRSQSIASKMQGDTITSGVKVRAVSVSSTSSFARNYRRVHNTTKTKTLAYYWRFLEFGTPQRHTKSGANRGLITPRPWVRPAFEARADAAIEAYRVNTRDRLDEEARQLPTGVPSS